MITILSDDKKQNIGTQIYELMKSKGLEVNYFSVVGLDVKPCYSCGACNTKTYGKCILKDDMEPILRKLIRTDRLVLVTPVTWGGYSSDIKKVFDRTSVLGDIHYYVKKGEMVKGTRSNMKQIYAIGVKDDCSQEEKETFDRLLQENANIMNISGKAFIVEQNCNSVSIVEEICR